MGNIFWIMIGVIVVTAIVGNMVVRIVKIAKESRPGGRFQAQVGELEETVRSQGRELREVRERVVVLEKIVTDRKHELGRQIDELPDIN